MQFYISVILIILAIILSLRTLFIPHKIKGKQVSFENFVIIALIYATVMAAFGLLYYLLDLKGIWVLSDVSMRPSTSSYERMSTSMYFSAITLFSVGYGDIAPVGIGRAIAVLEALIGYTIPAAFVTRAMFDQKTVMTHSFDLYSNPKLDRLKIIELILEGYIMTLAIGEKAPAFELPASNGETVKLSDYAGKNVVLYFYPKDMTPGCTTEACDFRDHHESFEGVDAVILGVSPDPINRHEKFIEKHGLPFLLLADEDHKTAEDYEVWKLKKNFGKEYMGIERSTFIIDKNGNLVKEWRKVKVKGHVEEALEYIKENL